MNKVIKMLLISLCVVSVSVIGSGIAGGAQRLLRGGWSWPTHIDPAVGSDISSSTALVSLYDALVYPDLKGNVQPHVAKSWEASADGLTWTFHLQKGVKFHDGSELTAEDVKFSMDRLTTIGEGFSFLFGERVASTEARDKYTVVFHLERRFAPFLRSLYMFFISNKDLVLANIERPGPYGDMGDYGKKYLLTHDAGSGPYMVKEFRIEEYLLMTQNPSYWEPEYARVNPLAPDEVKMYGTMTPVTIRTLMANRELEFSDAWQTPETLEALDKIEGIDIATYPGGGVYYLMMHTKKPPTDDVHLRKAVAWALDYDQLTKFFPGLVQARGPVPQTIPGADPTVLQYHRDLDKAMEHIKQSKYYGQLDKYPIQFDWNSDVPVLEKVGLLFMSNVGDVGIEVDLVKTPWSVVTEKSARMDTSPNINTIWAAGPYPEAGALLDLRYGSAAAATVEQNEWLLDPEYDEMLEDALSTMDEKERFAKYAKIQQYIMDLCPSIFMVEFSYRQAYQTYIDHPAFRGEGPGLYGYSLDPRFMEVHPE